MSKLREAIDAAGGGLYHFEIDAILNAVIEAVDERLNKNAYILGNSGSHVAEDIRNLLLEAKESK